MDESAGRGDGQENDGRSPVSRLAGVFVSASSSLLAARCFATAWLSRQDIFDSKAGTAMQEPLNFLAMSEAEIVDFICDHLDEFGTFSNSKASMSSRFYILRFPHGFAVVIGENQQSNQLWQLYVDRNYRGQGLGHQYLDIVLKHFSAGKFGMSLACVDELERFYTSCGFRVTQRFEGSLEMKYDPR